MANKEHIKLLKQGVDVWNKWRKKNKNIKPDLFRAILRDAVLRGANLRGAILKKANLTDANLSIADLSIANLSDAKLNGADLSGASLMATSLLRANLKNANLKEVNLKGAFLTGANLSGVDLSLAILTETDLNKTNLSGANLRGAIISKTEIDSKAKLNDLKYPLTEEQISSIIFRDEVKDKEEINKTDVKINKFPFLQVRFEDDIKWKVQYMGLFFVGLQAIYNILNYLITTKEKNVDVIKNQMEAGWFVDSKNDICFKRVSYESPLIFELMQNASEYIESIPGVLTVLGTTISVGAGVAFTLAKTYKSKKEGDLIDEKIKTEKLQREKIKTETTALELSNKKQLVDYGIGKDQYENETKKGFEKYLPMIIVLINNHTVRDNLTEILYKVNEPMTNFLFKLNITFGLENVSCKMFDEDDNEIE